MSMMQKLKGYALWVLTLLSGALFFLFQKRNQELKDVKAEADKDKALDAVAQKIKEVHDEKAKFDANRKRLDEYISRHIGSSDKTDTDLH